MRGTVTWRNEDILLSSSGPAGTGGGTIEGEFEGTKSEICSG